MILPPKDYDRWLDVAQPNAHELLRPYPPDGFNSVAILAAAMAVGRHFQMREQTREKDRQLRWIAGLRVTWMTGGHFGAEFDRLLSMLRSAGMAELDLDSDEYRKWWSIVEQDAKRKIKRATAPRP